MKTKLDPPAAPVTDDSAPNRVFVLVLSNRLSNAMICGDADAASSIVDLAFAEGLDRETFRKLILDPAMARVGDYLSAMVTEEDELLTA